MARHCHTRVLQANSVDHAAVALCNSGGRIAETGILGGTLEGEGAQFVAIVQFCELVTETEGTGSGDDGVIHLNAAEIHFGIYHKISSFIMTGPSLQMRL